MRNPFARIFNNPVVKAIGLEVIGNEAFALLRGGEDTVPEVSSGDKDKKDGKSKEGAGEQLRTGRNLFTKKDESAFGQAIGKLWSIDSALASIMAERTKEYNFWDRAAMRVNLSLLKDEESRVSVMRNWASMEDEEWKATETMIGIGQIQNIFQFLKKCSDKAKEIDASVASKIDDWKSGQTGSDEPESLYEGFDSQDDSEVVILEPDGKWRKGNFITLVIALAIPLSLMILLWVTS